MRINPDSTAGLLGILSMAKRQEESALLQLSSGRRVQLPSDDPAASAEVTLNNQTQSEIDQFTQSVGTVRELVSTADSTLSSVVGALERAVSLGVEGATGTLSAENRASLQQEIDGIRDQVLSLANTTFRGAYIFAGTNVLPKPFVPDTNAPSGTRYDGSQSVNLVQVGAGQTVTTGIPGDALFADAAGDVFADLQLLSAALSNNDAAGTAAATTDLRAALAHVSNQRVVYGNVLNQLESQDTFLQHSKLLAQTREQELVGADEAEAITQLRQAQFARDATLAAAARTQFTSLLDYLQ